MPSDLKSSTPYVMPTHHSLWAICITVFLDGSSVISFGHQESSIFLQRTKLLHEEPLDLLLSDFGLVDCDLGNKLLASDGHILLLPKRAAGTLCKTQLALQAKTAFLLVSSQEIPK